MKSPLIPGIRKRIRSYRLSDNKLIINDMFRLNQTVHTNQINFLTHGTIDLSTPGEAIIEVNGVKVKLSYNKLIFAPEIETIELDDPRLSNVWGSHIYRLSLNARLKSKKGNYEYSIRKL